MMYEGSLKDRLDGTDAEDIVEALSGMDRKTLENVLQILKDKGVELGKMLQ